MRHLAATALGLVLFACAPDASAPRTALEHAGPVTLFGGATNSSIPAMKHAETARSDVDHSGQALLSKRREPLS